MGCQRRLLLLLAGLAMLGPLVAMLLLRSLPDQVVSSCYRAQNLARGATAMALPLLLLLPQHPPGCNRCQAMAQRTNRRQRCLVAGGWPAGAGTGGAGAATAAASATGRWPAGCPAQPLPLPGAAGGGCSAARSLGWSGAGVRSLAAVQWKRSECCWALDAAAGAGQQDCRGVRPSAAPLRPGC